MDAIDDDAASVNNDPMPPPRYEVIKYRNTITDIILFFGAWKGYKLSEMIEDYDGRRYITTFLLSPDSNFPKDFQQVVQEVVDNRGMD